MEPPQKIFLAFVSVIMTIELVYSFTMESVPIESYNGEVHKKGKLASAAGPIIGLVVAVWIIFILAWIYINYFPAIKRRIGILINRLRELVGLPRPEERPVEIPMAPVVAVNGDLRNRQRNQ